MRRPRGPRSEGGAVTGASSIRLVRGDVPEWTAEVGRIFREYAASLPVDIGFQGFEAEMAALPGDYAAPRGRLLLAVDRDGRVAACGAFRPLDLPRHPNACEMKRLFVRPAFRGLGLGRTVAEALLADARAAGYAEMLLDTLDEMRPALALYAALGFVDTDAYCFNPIAGARFLKADL